MPEGSAAIVARGLTKVYGRLVAVDHVDLDVGEGEVFALLGPNGAGKTTTVGMLTTLLRPTEGTAIVGGYDVVREPDMVRRVIGVVPQEYTADEDLSGWENLMFMASLYGIPRDEARRRAAKLLEMVELSRFARVKVESYSGGMRRRLELAMGLINSPRILFLDEPTLGLDVQTRAAIWSYIRRLKDEYGMTILFTTHYMEEADLYATRIAIMDRGRIVKVGTPRELKDSIGGDVVTLNVDSMAAAKEVLRSAGIDAREYDGSLVFKLRDASTALPEILRALMGSGIQVRRMEVSEPTMDEVYLEYTGRRLRDAQASSEEAFALRATLRRARS
ncbi:MAG: ATP-binding cassette domain-containing protein [Nitrososphaeria archaeon]